ncbi:Uma2 family endonuclease [Gordonia amarae]|uniref:Uma2 family endonuclease n=2 Tax=Gordonia amarae TaxID=36821 RepID=A0A857KT37_9ACTN|nr:Uma2 family endonuclease [Gordonia amarae]QHN15666.1 Uma2 family endonuclease [Gordonia amarae]QHN20235.1 Uma2 family endonuclease [Gordonia amarae]QHN29086.1 Uma2 family endonuclease [Gordonia amarae]QHN37866.1 Uma2 family endonuclease [Gordonia amarae]GAB04254.1 hypothetical protein GOAMR_15_00360 [Gordonia amarae NBRC 15530]
MTVMTTFSLPHRRALTRADLAVVPDDGHRYELIDGSLIVSPAPQIRHQDAVMRLGVLLFEACPPELKVLSAPVDVVLADDSVIQPDLLVARRDQFTDNDLPGPPLLAIEVLSPSTRGIDLLLKKDRLERAGCPHYWVVDPEGPTISAWTLRDGRLVNIQTATEDELFSVTEPFIVSFAPSSLFDR